MNGRIFVSALLAAVSLVVGTWSPASAQEAIILTKRPWTGSVIVPSGGPIVPLFDGWYPNPDGTHTLCFGYYSTNEEEDITIPIGPNNFVEPAEYNGAQPDYFERIPANPFRYRRRYCVFPVVVPASFGEGDRVTWTIQRGREQPLSVPGKILVEYRLDELRAPGRGDVAPVLRFEEGGTPIEGRSGVNWGPLRAGVGQPLDLRVWVEHPATQVWVGWAKQNGPGDVTFSEQNTRRDPTTTIAQTTASFSAPGNYLLRVQSIDNPTSSFEFHCCWTNAFIEVIVE